MFLTALLLTRKILAAKAQIKINLSHFAKTTALAIVVALPLAMVDYTLTNQYPINAITKLILERVSFLIIYVVSLRLLRIVRREDLELLKKALPHQLERAAEYV